MKKKGSERRVHTKEFKTEAVALAEITASGMPPKLCSDALGCTSVEGAF